MCRLLLLILAATLTHGSSQNDCTTSIKVEPNKKYYITNKEYPENYSGGAECLWIAKCPLFYKCRLDCTDVDIPDSTMCYGDQLLVCRFGLSSPFKADAYCGTANFTVVSVGRKISVGLNTIDRSPGGRFNCTVTAQKKSLFH